MNRVEARRHPDGWIAQRLGDAERPWVLLTVENFVLAMELLTDDDVAGWPPLEDRKRPRT